LADLDPIEPLSPWPSTEEVNGETTEPLGLPASGTLRDVLACLANAWRLVLILQNYSAHFTSDHARQMASDIDRALKIIHTEVDKTGQSQSDQPESDLVAIVNRLPVGGRIVLERGH